MSVSTVNFIVVDDWIYFENKDRNFDLYYAQDISSRFNIYRMKADGSHVGALAEGSLKMYAEQGPYLYYASGDHRLFRMDTEGQYKTEMYHGEKDWHWINRIGESLYLLDWNTDESSRLYHIHFEGEELERFGSYKNREDQSPE